jgi:hypothetical protein
MLLFFIVLVQYVFLTGAELPSEFYKMTIHSLIVKRPSFSLQFPEEYDSRIGRIKS